MNTRVHIVANRNLEFGQCHSAQRGAWAFGSVLDSLGHGTYPGIVWVLFLIWFCYCLRIIVFLSTLSLFGALRRVQYKVFVPPCCAISFDSVRLGVHSGCRALYSNTGAGCVGVIVTLKTLDDR
jgi:hypothetical protein